MKWMPIKVDGAKTTTSSCWLYIYSPVMSGKF